jgi:hypothetical protein
MAMKTNRRVPSPATLRRLHELGSPVDLSVAEKERGVEIVQLSPPVDTNILDLDYGRAGCFFYVSIINQTTRPIYCIELELRLLWPDLVFHWLPDPRECQYDAHYYALPGSGAPEFPHGQVLNHVLLSGERCVLTPRVPYEGWLLAVGGPLPGDLRHGERLEATFAIITSEHTEYTEKIFFVVERRAVKPKFAKRESSLYEAPAGCRIESVVGDRIAPISEADSTGSSPDSESDAQNRPSRP